VGYQLIDCWTLFWVSSETFLHHIQDSLVVDFREGNGYTGVGNSVPFHHLVIDVLEWSPSVHHEVEDAPQRPDVTGSTHLKEVLIFICLNRLRGHVVNCSTTDVSLDACLLLLNPVCNVKVNQFQLRPRHHKVLWFQVIVDHPLIVNHLQ